MTDKHLQSQNVQTGEMCPVRHGRVAPGHGESIHQGHPDGPG